MVVSLLGHFRVLYSMLDGNVPVSLGLSLSLTRDADFCAMNMYRLLLCVFEFFFSHLYGIYLVPINCDSLRLGCGQGHCAMTSLTFLYMDEANNHIRTSFCQ